MKIFLYVLLIIFSHCACANENIAYGSMLLQVKFNAYSEKQEQCKRSADENILPNKVISDLSLLSRETGIGLGFYHFKAIEKCTSPEYLDFLTTLMSLESLNKKTQDLAIKTQINTYKVLLFSVNNIDLEKSYADLSEDVIKALLMIPELKKPFNAFDAYDRAWPQN